MDNGEIDKFKHPDQVNTKPEFRDLNHYVISQHAAKWKVLGTLLDLPRPVEHLVT